MTRLHRASNNAPIKLGEELGRGGEGIVSEVTDAPDLVAKVYFKPADPRKARKLAVLARQATPQLQDAGAWATRSGGRKRRIQATLEELDQHARNRMFARQVP